MPTVLDRRGFEPRSILVVLPTWVGDFVMATPLLRALRTRFPDARITFVAEPNLLDLIRGGDWMNDVALWPEKDRRKPWHGEYRALVGHLRKQRFDWAVLLPNSARSALLAFLSGAKRRIGYNRDGRGLLLTDRLPPKNYVKGRFEPLPLVEYYADLAAFLGCDPAGDRLELVTTTDSDTTAQERLKQWGIDGRNPLVVLGPGAKFGASKCWLPERYAAVADRLVVERGAAVVVTCGPGEEAIARQIGAAMRERSFVSDAPRFSLGEMKSLIRRADLLICNDAGLRHFAKAFEVPVVTVFGPTHPEWTATSYTDERIVRIDVDCGPCQQRVCPLGHLKCMTGVTADMVHAAAIELLDRRANSRSQKVE